MTMRSKGNIFTRLAQVSLVQFGSQEPFRAGKDAHVGTHSRLRSDVARGFSGSLVPAEARVKTKGAGGLLGTPHEPTSPKVSCMGKVKQTNKKSSSKQPRRAHSFDDQAPEPSSPRKKGNSQLRGLFGRRRKELASAAAEATADRPSLGQMKRLSSKRNALADFDWRSLTDDEDHSTKYSGCWVDVDNGGSVVELQPREEVNLWKRRTVARPLELHLNKS